MNPEGSAFRRIVCAVLWPDLFRRAHQLGDSSRTSTSMVPAAEFVALAEDRRIG
jgi:hypothetical protein